MLLESIEIIQIFIVIQCVIFSLYLFTTSTSLSNYLLGAFLIVLGCQLSLLTLSDYGDIYLYRLTVSFRFIFGPVLYFYVRSISEKDYQLEKYSLLHLAPFLLILIVLNLDVLVPRFVLLITINISAIGYLFASYLMINKYQVVIKETQPSYSDISLIWLQQLITFFLIVIIINFINNTLYNEPFWPGEIMTLVEMIVIFLLVNIMVYKGLKHPSLFSGITYEDIKIVEDSNDKYASSALNNQDLLKYKELVEQLMKDQEIYLNPELTLGDVAEIASISNRDLSQVINTQFNKNFSEFINQYRVERALHIFEKSTDDKMTVLEVLYEVGFNSKSSFYNAFKKYTGMTPKEYKSNQIKN